MLSLATVEEIRRLLDEGELSQRKIAEKLGVSRGSIGSIASGRRGIYGREAPSEQPSLCCLELPPERCPSCGAKVYKPCVLCRTREFQTRQALLEQLQGARKTAHRRVA